jgi:hypothetical protein
MAGWILLGKVEAFDKTWLIIQSESSEHRLAAGAEPSPEEWSSILAWLYEINFISKKRRQAAIIMSAWEAKPEAPSYQFQCIERPAEMVNTSICHTCAIRYGCAKTLETLYETDPEYKADIEAADEHVPGKLELT